MLAIIAQRKLEIFTVELFYCDPPYNDGLLITLVASGPDFFPI